MLGRFEVRVVDPKLLPVTDRHARRVPFYFAPELVRNFKPNFAQAHDRLVHQMNHFLFPKVGLRMWSCSALRADACEQILELGLRKRISVNRHRECQIQSDYGRDGPPGRPTNFSARSEIAPYCLKMFVHIDCGSYRPSGSGRQLFGSTAAAAGRVKKIVATRLQKMPIAQVMPSPLSEGFLARPNDPKPLTAVRPARRTGFTTPATSCSSSFVFCHTSKT